LWVSDDQGGLRMVVPPAGASDFAIAILTGAILNQPERLDERLGCCSRRLPCRSSRHFTPWRSSNSPKTSSRHEQALNPQSALLLYARHRIKGVERSALSTCHRPVITVVESDELERVILADNTLDGRNRMAADYRYQHFTTSLLIHDGAFHKAATRPGEMFPEFNLPTTDGARVTTQDYAEHPLLLVTGSITCPMTASAMPALKRLYSQCGDDVAFVMLNVREAYPGENFPQPDSMEEKIDHARALKDFYRLPWIVAVDDLDGTLNLAMDAKPNSAYLMDRDGRVVFRSIWARGLRGSIGPGAGVRRTCGGAVQGREPGPAASCDSGDGGHRRGNEAGGPHCGPRSLAVELPSSTRRAHGVVAPAAIARLARNQRRSHPRHCHCDRRGRRIAVDPMRHHVAR
jgi:hypothetical protein